MVNRQSGPFTKTLELFWVQILDYNGVLKILRIMIDPKRTIIWLFKYYKILQNILTMEVASPKGNRIFEY